MNMMPSGDHGSKIAQERILTEATKGAEIDVEIFKIKGIFPKLLQELRQIAQSEASSASDKLKPVIDQLEQAYQHHVQEIERINKPGGLTPTEIEVIRLTGG